MKALKVVDKNGQKRTLSPAQLNAVELLSQGFNDTETAKAVKVTRQSIHSWRTGNQAFQEALTSARETLWRESRNQLRSLTGNAIKTLKNAIEGGSVLASVAVLRHALAIMPEEKLGDTTIHVVYNWVKDKTKPEAEEATLREKYQKAIDTGDYSKLTDDELKALSNAIDPLGEIKKLSNEELLALKEKRKK